MLVVDDSRPSRDAGVGLLAAAGYQSVAAEDGREAWEILSERRFDAVVTALEMPRLDGFQLIARIRREATLHGLPRLSAPALSALPHTGITRRRPTLLLGRARRWNMTSLGYSGTKTR